MSTTFIDQVHAQNVLQRMWEQTERNEHCCDVALIPGVPGDSKELQISAHRSVLSASSEYFKTMFTPPFTESKAREVKLPNVDGESLKSLVKFCYSGRLEMNEDNAENLLITADSLLLDAVVNACGNFLAEQLHPTNCLGMAQLAERHRCESLAKKAKEFSMKHFVKLYKTDEFLNLSVEQLTQFLASDDLCDPTEEHVFKSLMIWLEHDRSEREQHKDEMLKWVRLPLLEPTFLIDYVQPICTSFTSLKLYTTATDWLLAPHRRTEIASELTKRRRSAERLMAIKIGDNKMNIFYHCPQQLKWLKWLENLEHRRGFAVAVMDDDLFIVGGNIGYPAVKTVNCLNLKTLSLKNVNPMNVPRCAFGVAVINGFLYAVGGSNGNEAINSVEKWDSKSNAWNMVASMSISRYSFGMTVFKGNIYVVGGSSGRDIINLVECYNPQENIWTSIASMCETRLWPGLVVSNGMLYVVGERGQSTLERYEPETNKWTMMCSFSDTISSVLSTTFNDKIIAFHTHHVEEYNSTTNKFKVNASITKLEDVERTFSFSGSLLESQFI